MSLNSLKTVSRRKKHTEAILLSNNESARAEDCSYLPAYLTKLDFLGSPVTFNYKGSQTYDSATGCCCSIVVTALLLAYVLIALQSIAANETRAIT